MFKWIWASHPTWQSCRCHQFFPKPASSAEERWLSISIASLLYSDQGCDDMMAVVGWVAGRVEWCSGDVGNFICCYFASLFFQIGVFANPFLAFMNSWILKINLDNLLNMTLSDSWIKDSPGCPNNTKRGMTNSWFVSLSAFGWICNLFP